MKTRYLILPAALAVVLAACSTQDAPPADDVTTDAPAPVADQPAEDVPPATAPAVPDPVAGATQPAPDGDADLARFDGYGDIRFGTAAADMGRQWGGELNVLGQDDNPTCYFMTPKWVKAPADFNFMIGNGRFVRFGTESERFVAPGGGKVGMTKAQVAALYAGRIQEQPHKYTDGLYLRIGDAGGGKGVLVFEIDGKGDAAQVTEWRVGVPPEVDYVEGCS